MDFKHSIISGLAAIYLAGCSVSGTAVPNVQPMPGFTPEVVDDQKALERMLIENNRGTTLLRALQEVNFYFFQGYGAEGSRTAEIVGTGWINSHLFQIVENGKFLTVSSPTIDRSGVKKCTLRKNDAEGIMKKILGYKTGEAIDKDLTAKLGYNASVSCQ